MTTAHSLIATYYEILATPGGDFDRARFRSLLAGDFTFDGPIAGHVQGADRFVRGIAGFIETQHGIRMLQQVVTDDGAASLYDADLPHGTLRFAEFLQLSGDVVGCAWLLYDAGKYREYGGR